VAKTFYTKVDIEKMAASGVTLLQIHDDVVLTAEAHEVAKKLGLHLAYVPAYPEAPRRPGKIPDLQSRTRQVVTS
jgi:hypothetical protein